MSIYFPQASTVMDMDKATHVINQQVNTLYDYTLTFMVTLFTIFSCSTQETLLYLALYSVGMLSIITYTMIQFQRLTGLLR